MVGTGQGIQSLVELKKIKQKTQNLEHPAHRRKNLGPLKILLYETRKCRSEDPEADHSLMFKAPGSITRATKN